MKTTIPLAFALALVVSGCNDASEQQPRSTAFDYVATLAEPVPFQLPAGTESRGAKTVKSQGSGQGRVEPVAFRMPKTWTVYMATSVYTDGRTPRSQRVVTDIGHMKALANYLESNGIREKVSLVWLQYDDIPTGQGALANEADKGWDFLPNALSWIDSSKYFDWYVVSPASRFGKQGTLRYDQWLSPYLWYANTPSGRTLKDFDLEQGAGDYKSKFWDNWNRHFFLVNPEGLVVESWVGVGSNLVHVFPDRVMAAVTHHLGLEPASVIYPEVNRDGKYFSDYKPPVEDQLLNTVNHIEENTSDR